MKSRKILAAAAITMSASLFATAGFAATATVSTTTTYNYNDDKIQVGATVSGATPSSEVTYLAKSGDEYLFIDQKTAGTDGATTFDYLAPKSKLSGLTSSVKLGSSKGDTFAPVASQSLDLGLENVTVTGDENTNFSKESGVAGYGETIPVTVSFEDGYEADTIKLNGEAVTDGTLAFNLNPGDALVVTSVATYTEPGISDSTPAPTRGTTTALVNGEETVVPQLTQVIAVSGNPTEVGIIVDGVRFPSAVVAANVAVRVVYNDDRKAVYNASSEVKTYYAADGRYYYADGTEIQ